MENKTAFFKKWLSTGRLDTHLAKSLILSITCPQHLKKTFGVKTVAYNWEIPTNCFKGNL